LAALTDRQIGVLTPESPHVAVFCPRDRDRMRRACSEVLAAFSAPSGEAAYEKFHAWGARYVLVGIAERSRFGAMPQFADRSRFEQVYNDGNAAVYRLATPVSASGPAAEKRENRP
jgi:hypothetical protein